MADALIIIGILGLIVIILGLTTLVQSRENGRLKGYNGLLEAEADYNTVTIRELEDQLDRFAPFDGDHDGKPGGSLPRSK